jgi:hypothetical protein
VEIVKAMMLPIHSLVESNTKRNREKRKESALKCHINLDPVEWTPNIWRAAHHHTTIKINKSRADKKKHAIVINQVNLLVSEC